MYSAVKVHRSLFRISAGLVAFVYAYFGFVAALHHRDGFVPTGKTLSFHSVECGHSHPEVSKESGDPECGVCEFQASLKFAALAIASVANPTPDAPLRIESAESLAIIIPESLHGPRGPPSA